MKAMRSMPLAVFAAALVLGVTHSAWAGTVDKNHVVTVNVNPILGISSETGDFTLAFTSATGSGANAVSTNIVAAYNVEANSMPNAALAGAVSAKLSALIPNIEIRGTTAADSYTNLGSASAAILSPVNTSETTPTVVGTAATAFFDKPTSSGGAGRVLHGTAYVSWTAKTLVEQQAGTLGTPTLTVTLKDA
jgi:hypothetical protein